MPDESTAFLHFRLEVTEYADVEVDVAKVFALFSGERATFEGTDEDFVKDALLDIGFHDALYDYPGVRVLYRDSEEAIHSVIVPRGQPLS